MYDVVPHELELSQLFKHLQQMWEIISNQNQQSFWKLLCNVYFKYCYQNLNFGIGFIPSNGKKASLLMFGPDKDEEVNKLRCKCCSLFAFWALTWFHVSEFNPINDCRAINKSKTDLRFSTESPYLNTLLSMCEWKLLHHCVQRQNDSELVSTVCVYVCEISGALLNEHWRW